MPCRDVGPWRRHHVVAHCAPMTSGHITPGSILVGVDGSDHAERAVLWAAEQAVLEKRALVVLHADPFLSRNSSFATAMVDSVELRRQVNEEMEAIASRASATATSHRPIVDVESLVVHSDPREALVDASRHAHMLVVGSRGRGMLRSMLMGSVSANVARQAKCPVVVIRPESGTPTRSGVMVGADGTAESQPVLEFAFRQASWRNLPLTIMHTYFDASAAIAEYRGNIAEGPAAEVRLLLAESVAGLAEKYPDVPVTRAFSHGLVDECLLSTPHEWAMIVVGRHPLGSVTRALSGSVAITVLEHSEGVVAIVPEGGPLTTT